MDRFQQLEQDLADARKVGNRRNEASILNDLGWLAKQQGQIMEAFRYFEESLVICRQIGERIGEGITLESMTIIALLSKPGGLYDARRYLAQAIESYEAIGAETYAQAAREMLAVYGRLRQ